MGQSTGRRWERARRYVREQQFSAAHVQLKSLRAADPTGLHTHLLAAELAWHDGHPREAAAHALEAAQLPVDDPGVLADLVETLLHVGEVATAHRLFDNPLWANADASDLLFRHAELCQRFRRHAQALALLDRLLAREPGNGRWQFYRGQQLEFLGRLEDAEAAYLTCLRLMPGYGYVAYALVRVRRQRSDDGRLELIESGLRHAPPGGAARADFAFARYHLLEDLEQTDAAWDALATANRLMFEFMGADAAKQQAGLLRFSARTRTTTARAANTKHDGARPIFIVGMPRSGTTLLERMLANHSQVAGAGELTDFAGQLLRAADASNIFGEPFLSKVATLDLDEVARGYHAQTAWRAGDKPHYIDKQPANWLLAGMIHAAMPDAKILRLVRDPMDTCFSIWRARFASTHAWSYDFDALAARFNFYRDWMRHWHEACPGAILDVDYRKLVTEPAVALREVTDFCGLAWEPGCEDVTRNMTPVSTLSAAQVREPVHTRGLGRWQVYAQQLEPLRKQLAGADQSGS